GIHMIAEVKINEALAGYTDRIIENLKSEFTEKGVTVGNIVRQSNTSFVIQGVPLDKQDQAKTILEKYAEWEISSFNNGQVVGTLRQAVISKKSDQAVEQAVRIIRERVDKFGVAEAVVQREGISGGRVLIQLPGVEDTDRVKKLIEGTAKLELKLVTGGPASAPETLMQNGQVPAGQQILPHTALQQDGSSRTDYLLVQQQAIISGEELQSANRSSDTYGRPAVSFTLQSSAGDKFGRFTEANKGKSLAIVRDNKVPSYPTINDRITTNGIIQGQFTIEEANDLAVMLQSGALPAGLRFLQQTVVGPSLGADSIRKGMIS